MEMSPPPPPRRFHSIRLLRVGGKWMWKSPLNLKCFCALARHPPRRRRRRRLQRLRRLRRQKGASIEERLARFFCEQLLPSAQGERDRISLLLLLLYCIPGTYRKDCSLFLPLSSTTATTTATRKGRVGESLQIRAACSSPEEEKALVSPPPSRGKASPERALLIRG